MPTRDTAWPAGTPCWVDYSAPDVDAAKSFYADALGWTYTEPAAEFGGYFNALSGGRLAAGMGPQMEEEHPPAWVTYFSSDDAQESADRITANGGTIIGGPHPIGTLGHMVVALDPQGHVFGVWQPLEFPGITIFNEPGSLVWNEAAVADPAAAREFYSAVFGFTFDEIEGMDGYSTFKKDAGALGGLGGVTPGAPQGWSTSFSVASVDDTVATVERGGGKVTMAAQDTSFGRFAVVEDPWGAGFSLMQELDS